VRFTFKKLIRHNNVFSKHFECLKKKVSQSILIYDFNVFVIEEIMIYFLFDMLKFH